MVKVIYILKKAVLLFLEKIIENENYLIEITDFHKSLKEKRTYFRKFFSLKNALFWGNFSKR